ncbi:putative bifunctional diguanylate cyclase/phosphodiesterase [Sphingomonas sp.]|jgi:diguanylate cyclase (GGDEF)-like protein|uniref:putative bifunctional diguanylate cyclase/phosphodiesterase n=1 Tax=Sphingomonas sp. TaxID=28214 RepID=UPI002E361FFD|nr:EAL domain-containing protein [Sphingomonas sp.]HEX4695963.1 EAL domain-containing protein [Sphingomonas sp.]
MLAISVTLLAVAEHSATDQVERELAATGTVSDRLWSQRAAQLGGAAGLLARDFGFRAAVATGDKPTIVSALDNLKRRMGVPVAFVVGADGNVVGGGSQMSAEAAGLWNALDAGQTSGVTQLGGTPHQVIAAPILAPQLIGWVVFATDLDVKEMRGLQSLSAIPIQAAVFQRRENGQWADPFDPESGALSSFIERAAKDRSASEVTTPTGTALALVKPLPTMAGAPDAVLLLRYPLDLALAGYHRLQVTVLLAGLLGLLTTLFATFRMARSITRPVTLLEAAAARLAAGNEASVPVEGNDELSRLAESFNRMATDIAERERRITQLAFNDTLTGLPNRAHFLEHVEHELKLSERNGGGIAVLIADLDNFKSVNDTLGHPVGDELLRQVAAQLDTVLGHSFVARLGGDEFVIVARQDPDDPIERLAKRALDAVGAPTRIDGHDVTPGASIGIAISPGDGTDARALLKNADLALHRAKELGRRTFCFFEEALNQRAQERRRIEGDLRIALQEGQFELHFQPLFDLARDRIGSFEALLRWHHPTRGFVSPAEFIPIAEEMGLIVEIGAWALRDACQQATAWPEHVRVAVNVSSVQCRRPGLNETVMRALAASGLSPSRLELEITESIFLEGSDATFTLLHGLRGLGVRVALDDFGTGYSSLSYLQRFPFDKIKIDQSFIRDLLTRSGAVAIVRAITDLARALGMETTAEGVEEEAQLAELRKHGCTSVQGYLFSKPVDGAAVQAMLADDTPRRAAVG